MARAGIETVGSQYGQKEYSMSSKNWKNAASIFLITIAILAFAVAAKPVSANGGAESNHFPNVELITQDGKKVHFYDDLVKDKRVVIQFMFTRCKDICPVITHHLVEVQRVLNGRVGRDIFFYSISLSPEEDSPKELKEFAKSHHA